MVKIGEPAPDFLLRDQSRVKRSLADLAGAKGMVIFMPFAFTNTCLGEMCTLRATSTTSNQVASSSL